MAEEQSDDDLVVRPSRGGSLRWIAIPVGVLVIGLIALLASGDRQRNTGEGLIVGQAVPPVAGETRSGDTFDIDDFRGQWVYVNFFATWCVPCIVEHPELTAFDENNPEVELVSVVFNDELDAVNDFFEQRGGEWPVIVGDTGIIGLDFGVTGLPETFLIRPDGIVAERIAGGVTAEGLEGLVDAYRGVGS